MSIVNDKNLAAHYLWGNSCYSWMLLNNNEFTVKQEQMPAGSKDQLHLHEHANQYFYILKGTATLELEQKIVHLREQQGIFIQNNNKHAIANNSNEILEFLVISQPSTDKDRINL